MLKVPMILVLVSFLVCTTFAQEPFNTERFLAETEKEFMSDAKELNDRFKLGDHDRWDFHQENGKLIFSQNGKQKVIASVQIAGSYSTYSSTWKWSWANESVSASVRKDLDRVKKFGEKNQMKQLTTAQWKYPEDYAWTLTSMAGQVIKAKGAFRGAITDGFVYFLITEIKWVDEK